FLNNLYHTMEIAKYDLQRFEEYYGEYFRELDRKCELEYAVKEGETRGEARGEARGIKKGRKDAFVELALKMLECGEPADKITLYTGLTQEEIAALCP
ncbi:MAG: hypothetical protein IJ795_04445, partial [Bacteroidales bacterium]|nr:hypothetical protein [Bacteroidales bacterium]